MKTRTTIILLALLLGGVGYLLYHQYSKSGTPATNESDTQAKRMLPPIDSIDRLSIQSPSGTLVLRREQEKWRIVEPMEAEAKAWQASSAATLVANLNYLRKYAPGDADLPKDDLTKLSAPRFVAAVTDGKGKSHTIKVGQRVLLASQLYAQVEGDAAVYVIDGDLESTLTRQAGEFRETAVVKFEADKARRLRLQPRGLPAIQVVKIDKDRWALDEPVSARADGAKIQPLLSKLSSLSADKFVNDKPSPADLIGYGLAQPQLVATVELEPEKPAIPPATGSAPATQATQPAPKLYAVAFGNVVDKKVFARVGSAGSVFQLDEAVLKELQPKPADLRDKHVLDLPGGEITKVEIELLGGGSSVLEKVNYDWTMKQPFAGAADEENLIGLLSLLRSMEASEFRDNPESPAAFGLEPPKGKITMHFRGSDATHTLLIGQTSASGQMGFVLPAGGKSVAVINSNDYARLNQPAPNYWGRTLLKLPADAELAQVTLGPAGSDKARLVRDERGQYKALCGPALADMGPADKEAATSLVDALRTVKADKLVALNNDLPAKYAALATKIEVELSYRTPKPAATGPATSSAPATGSAPATSSAPATGSAPASRAVEYQTHQAPALVVAQDGDKCYVWQKAAKPLAVGELPAEFFKKLSAELRERAILNIDAAKAAGLKVAADKISIELTKSGEIWTYAADRFVKVGADQVKEFLTSLSQIKALRFVDHSDKPDLARFGLDKPAMTIEVKTDAPEPVRVLISRAAPVGAEGHYAWSSQAKGVFILGKDQPDQLQKGLEKFKEAATGAPDTRKP